MNKVTKDKAWSKVATANLSEAAKPSINPSVAIQPMTEEDVGVIQTPAQMITVLNINLPDHTAEVWEVDGIQYARVKVT